MTHWAFLTHLFALFAEHGPALGACFGDAEARAVTLAFDANRRTVLSGDGFGALYIHVPRGGMVVVARTAHRQRFAQLKQLANFRLGTVHEHRLALEPIRHGLVHTQRAAGAPRG